MAEIVKIVCKQLKLPAYDKKTGDFFVVGNRFSKSNMLGIEFFSPKDKKRTVCGHT